MDGIFLKTILTKVDLTIKISFDKIDSMLSIGEVMRRETFNFGRSVKQLNNIMEMRFNHSLKQWDLTSSQFSVIIYLLHNQDREVNQKMIEDAFLLKGPTVTGIVKRLVEKDFIRRRPDCQDRRINYLELTDNGQALESLVCKEITRLETDTLRGISAEHIDLLEDLLNQVLKNITCPTPTADQN
jgi:DNA-binding MarR family transcriptional regulator